MPICKQTEILGPGEYYGLVDDIVEAEPGNGYSRSFLLLDCVDGRRFRESGAEALVDPSALTLVRAMSTPRRWAEQFDFADFSKGDWVAFTLDDRGDAPRAWELPAAREYVSGPARSVRSIRRLGDGSPPPEGRSDDALAYALALASARGRVNRDVVELDAFAERLAGAGDEAIEIIALDVGQASATLIRRGGRAIGLFDAGAPIWFNKGSIAPNFSPPVISDGFVFLSHWDFDHFDLGRRHAPYRDLDWYAPDQAVGPNTAKFQVELGSKLTFVNGVFSRGGFTFARGTSTLPKDRNCSGYQLRYEKNDRAVLLTGDANYASIVPHMLTGLDGLLIPHHGGLGTTPPPPIGLPARAIASYGLPNHYRHPHSDTIKEHWRVGWQVLATATGTLPRGNRTLYP